MGIWTLNKIKLDVSKIWIRIRSKRSRSATSLLFIHSIFVSSFSVLLLHSTVFIIQYISIYNQYINNQLVDYAKPSQAKPGGKFCIDFGTPPPPPPLLVYDAGKFSKIHKMFTQKICLTKIIFKFFVKLIIVKNVTTASRKFRKHSWRNITVM